MDQPPPRPTTRPVRNKSHKSDEISQTNSMELDPRQSVTTEKSSEKPPHPAKQPIRIQPANPDPPEITRKSSLQQRLEALDTADAANNPEAIREFKAVSKALDQEGPGGSTAFAIQLPALGPQKIFKSKSEDSPRTKPAGADQQERTDTTKSGLSPVKYNDKGVIIDVKDDSIDAYDLKESHHEDGPAKTRTFEDEKIGSKADSTSQTNEEFIDKTVFEDESLVKCGGADELSNVKGSSPVIETPLKDGSNKGANELSSISSSAKPLQEKSISLTSDNEKMSSLDENFTKKSSSRGHNDSDNIDISQKTPAESQDSEDNEKRSLANELEQKELMEVDFSGSKTGPEKSIITDSDKTRMLNDPLSADLDVEVDPKDTSNSILARSANRPPKPLGPKPKSTLASRFEAALRETETPKPKPFIKPKRDSGDNAILGGRIAALQNSMFADLDAALSRGPPPGGRPRLESQGSRKSTGSTASTNNDDDNDDVQDSNESHIDNNESADSQINAMPKFPKSRFSGPGRRRRLPESAKPKLKIVAPVEALWEIPVTTKISRNPSTSDSDTGSEVSLGSGSEAGGTIGVETEHNLRNALVKSLSRTSSKSSSEDEKVQSRLAEVDDTEVDDIDPSPKAEVNTDPVTLKSTELSELGLPPLRSLIDREPSPSVLENNDQERLDDPVEDMLSNSDSLTVATPSAETLGVNLSRYLDKSPQTPLNKIAAMSESDSYFPALPPQHKLEDTEETPGVKDNDGSSES